MLWERLPKHPIDCHLTTHPIIQRHQHVQKGAMHTIYPVLIITQLAMELSSWLGLLLLLLLSLSLLVLLLLLLLMLQFGLNRFSGLTTEEFLQQYTGRYYQ
jgi:hypothetical protein